MSSYIRQLHGVVDSLVAPIFAGHGARLRCGRGCHACCVDDITVFDVEAQRIREEFAGMLASEAPHPVGTCAMLDEAGGCRIYAARPYVCRTEGIPLRWGSPEGERRDICPLNEAGEPIESLDPAECWTLGPIESRLEAAQATTGEPGKRVALRALFAAR